MRQTSETAAQGRANALWGGGGKRLVALLAVVAVVLVAALGGFAGRAQADRQPAYTSPGLLEDAQANPDATFNVIVQVAQGRRSAEAASEVQEALTSQRDGRGRSSVRRSFFSVGATSATLTGRQIVRLAQRGRVESITRDVKVEMLSNDSSDKVWTDAANVKANWAGLPDTLKFPTIAVVDSGMTGLPAFGSRLTQGPTFLSYSTNNSANGHGTFVGSIAAGAETNFGGAEPRANLISIKVLDGNGIGYKSDLIAACDWILQNKDTYNIRVANFSVNTGADQIRYDALDKAVERLWLNGIVVVAAAGNYAVNGAESGVGFAPANDPFVITVGASDTQNTSSRWDDKPAPWSAYGFTQDGFRKPEVSAPGRYLVGTVPFNSRLAQLFPDRVTGASQTNQYMWMSGTSFAAPVVSGIAASLLAKNPTWTPDQVKGAIMQTATVPNGYTPGGQLGLGVVNANRALSAPGTANPHLGLRQFSFWNAGQNRWEFNADAWRTYAAANASWNSASWSSASWSSASWSSASWSSASWASASWSSASWASASWSSASWASAFPGE